MAKATDTEAGTVLDSFMELMFKLMMDHHQKQTAELDLTLPQAQALKILRREPLCTGELANRLKISAPAVTQLTDRMVRKQLIERRPMDGDRRSVLVVLTSRGRRVVDRFRDRRNEIFCDALDRLSGEDRAQVVLALERLVAALEKIDAQAVSEVYGASNIDSRHKEQPEMMKN